MESPVGRALLRLAGVSLVAVAVVGLLAPRPVNVEHRWQVVVPVTLGLVLLAAVVRVPAWAKQRWVPLAVAVGGGVVATFVGLMTRYRYGWDARIVMDMARGLQSGRPLSQGEYDYLSLYPNNLPLLAIDRLGVAVGQAFSLAPDAVLIPLNGICVGVTLYAVHDLVGRVAGRGPSLVAQLATLVLVGTSPWLAVPYTDFYAMPFVVGGVALAVRAMTPRARTGRVVLWLLAVVAVSVAYAIKTTPVVIAIAAVLTAVVAIAVGLFEGDGRSVAEGILAAILGATLWVAIGTSIALLAQVADRR
jgi:hypothetical protein